ncbi:RDD family protein [Campylobacter canadensis]|uniref:RDD family protein n=1 Tax=Campylobacter canadensis TaxID=449520 RepID=A0ABS7WT03_9BACT|nr:RDD family protein [Campylobacter canadensis]MBZ7987887.1 RDD family protein [Campylobacter canadensis]MBZ7995337.1 RDD family protein [Campylobacter canadensis]MBZ7996337.1 RDD family protein [Campylobacter canadensis]MBZ7998369.1 RDD family protein [Campylobacter canadensis]MBZ8000084.1 RDD family protein [Campylobacter canadensis]
MAKVKFATIYDRFKAGIIDLFMIMMPIQYFFTYIIAGSAFEYRSSQMLIAYASIFYIFILILFFLFKAQSPGYKYMFLHLRAIDGKKANLYQLVLRFIIFLISFAFLFGIVFPFFRKDNKFIHDILSKTIVLKELK